MAPKQVTSQTKQNILRLCTENKSVADIAHIFGLPMSTVFTILGGNRVRDLELEIMKLTSEHNTLAEIADTLCVARSTVVETLRTTRLRVFDFLNQGMTISQVARITGISKSTVANMRCSMHKLFASVVDLPGDSGYNVA